MKHIQKREEPAEIIKWKQKFKNIHERRPKYEDIVGEEKKILKDSLLSEQGNICCYCCKRIADANSHIEHFRPKGQPAYRDLSLEYDNLHASCQGYHNREENCGHVKLNEFDEDNLISPLEEDCEKNFKFSSRGKIMPVEGNERAKYTIGLLKLDTPVLNAARNTAMWESGSMEEMTGEECVQLLAKFSSKDENGQYAGFCDVIIYQLKKQLEELQKNRENKGF